MAIGGLDLLHSMTVVKTCISRAYSVIRGQVFLLPMLIEFLWITLEIVFAFLPTGKQLRSLGGRLSINTFLAVAQRKLYAEPDLLHLSLCFFSQTYMP